MTDGRTKPLVVFVLMAVATVLAVSLRSPGGATASSARPDASAAGAYLISLYRNVRNPAILVEIVRPDGKVARIVERTSFGGAGYGHAFWSPDGTMLAWFDAHGLNVENSDGTGERQLVAYSTVCRLQCQSMSYAWSPDSRTIAVGGAGEQTSRLIEIDVADGKAHDIEPVRRWTEYVVMGFSPDGQQLAFTEEAGRAGSASCCHTWLVVSHADGSEPRRLFSFADPIHDGPQNATWSPDSRSLAFTDDGQDTRDPTFAIVDAATGTISPYDARWAEGSPVWSPDASKLALARRLAPSTSYAIDALAVSDGSLTRVGLGDVPIAWSSDGLITAIGNGNSSVRVINLNSGSERTLFAVPKFQLLSVDPYPAQAASRPTRTASTHKLIVGVESTLAPAAEKKLAVLVLVSHDGVAPAGALATPSKPLTILQQDNGAYRVRVEIDSCKGRCAATYRVTGSANHELEVVTSCEPTIRSFACSSVKIVKVY